MKKRWISFLGVLTAASLLSSTLSSCAMTNDPASAQTKEAAQTEEAASEGKAAQTEETAQAEQTEQDADVKLTLEDIDLVSGGKAKVFLHDGRVTLVDGPCTAEPVQSMEDAGKVVDSMLTLIGGDEKTAFHPWSSFTDTAGNRYYVFQQVYGDSTVPGGAVKVITGPDGSMLALSSSVEAELPDATKGGISRQEAEQIVLDHARKTNQPPLTLMEDWTQEIILPNMLRIDITSDDEGTRYVWAVYTNNPAGGAMKSDLPYLAHYVTMGGEYLYSLPTITPGDRAGSSGFDTDYVFEFMEDAEYTGYVDLSDGTEKKITVTVMRDKRTGMYYLGNLERRIVVADCYEFLYNDGSIVLEYSPDNRQWDQTGLLSLYNYCLAYDYYREIGWIGGDNEGTPILILNNFCDDQHMQVDNACYCGYVLGWQVFAASQANDFSQCIDVIAHEFTHCVTHTAMTYNAYLNDYGAINEGISDIHGQLCKMMNLGADQTNWMMGEQSREPARSLKDPHWFQQPEYVWDRYYRAPVETPTEINDQGGVHANSSLLNSIAYRLYADGGMSLEDARAFWFAADCTMVPKTDYVQLSELLPVVLKNLGIDRYEGTLKEAIDDTRIAGTGLPETFGDNLSLVRLELPDNDTMTDGNWLLQIYTVDIDRLAGKIREYSEHLENHDYSFLPPVTRRTLEELTQTAEEDPSQAHPAGKESEKEPSLLELALETVFIMLEGPTEETAAASETEALDEELASEIQEEMTEWILKEFEGIFDAGSSSAGQDGRTVELVCSTGYTIPLLIHLHALEGSMTQMDQFATAVLLGGHWYDVSQLLSSEEDPASFSLESFLDNEQVRQFLDDLIAGLEKLNGFEDLPGLFTVRIEGGGITTLPSDGLERITIPDGPAMNLMESSPVTEGPKSRPAETEPAETKPAATEPAETESAATESAETEPAGTEPAGTEPAATEPAEGKR